MSDLSIKHAAYSAVAATAVKPVRDTAQPVAVKNEKTQDASKSTTKEPVKESKKPLNGLQSVEEAISRYVPEARPNTRLQIEHDKDANKFIYRSVDKETGEVIRQYPADEILRFISYNRESEGLIVDSEA